VTTVIYAVDTQYAFIKSDLGGWVAGAFAVFLTDMALGTFITDFADSPQGKAAQYPKKRSCRADKTAVKARYCQI
jgi:hypothetical protein